MLEIPKDCARFRRMIASCGPVVALAVSLIWLLTHSSSAATFRKDILDVDGRTVHISVSDTYCRLEGQDELELLMPGGLHISIGLYDELLAVWVACEQWDLVRQGKASTFGRMAAASTRKDAELRRRIVALGRPAFIERNAEALSSKDFLESVRGAALTKATQNDIDEVLGDSMFEPFAGDTGTGVREDLEEIRREMLAGDWALFPLGKDEVAAYVGVSVPFPADRTLAGVSAITVMNGVPLNLVIYDLGPSLERYQSLRNEVRGVVQRAIAESEGR